MKTGFEAVQSAIEEASERRSGSGFLQTIVWRDDRKGEGRFYERVVRFLTDEVVPLKLYEYIPCKDGKKRDFIVPSSVGIEGPDLVQESGVKIPAYNNQSKLLVPRPRDVTMGLVALREEVPEMVDGRRVMTIRDRMETVKVGEGDEQEEKEVPIMGLVKQSNTNFWGTMAGYWARYGTITDRDYLITRTGNGTDTTYTIIPLDPVEELRDPEKLKERYVPVTSLEDYIKGQASVERARKLLLGESETKTESKTESKAEPEAKSESTKDETEFSSLRDELLQQK